jgi:hypothetical protein
MSHHTRFRYASFRYTYLTLVNADTRPGDDIGKNTLYAEDGWTFCDIGEGRWLASCPGGHRVLEAHEVAVVGVAAVC